MVPAVQLANLSMRCEAQSLCQSLDQYSVRCDKEGLGRGPYTVPIHTSSYPNPCSRMECHANDPIALLFKTLKVALKEKKKQIHTFIPESMTTKGDSKHNQLSFSKANTPAGKRFLLEFSSAVCRVGKVGSWARTVYVCVHACVCVCLHGMPVAPVSSAPLAAHFMRLPLAKTEH